MSKTQIVKTVCVAVRDSELHGVQMLVGVYGEFLGARGQSEREIFLARIQNKLKYKV